MSEDDKKKKFDISDLGPLNYKKGAHTTDLSKQFSFSKYAIEADVFDFKNFERLLKKNPKFRKMYSEYAQDYPPFQELQQDVYSALYKYRPHKIDEQLMDTDYILNREIMDMVMDTNKYGELRMVTQLDPVTSAVGTEVISEEVKEIVDQVLEEHQDLLDQMKAAQQAMQDAMQGEGDQEGEGPGGPGGPGDGDGEEGEGQQRLSLEEAQKVMEEARRKLKNNVRKDVEERVENAVHKASEKTQEIKDYITNWGLDADPSFKRTSYQDKIKKIDRLRNSSKLNRISKLAGRYKKIAQKSKKLRVRKAHSTITDVTLGDQVERMLSSEAALLQHPKTKKYFYKKILDSNLHQYKYGGDFSLGMGPLVVCIDSSGSMDGSPEIWAKSVAMSLLDIARRQHRPFVAIHFDAGSKGTLHVNKFPNPGRSFDVDEAIDMAEYFAGGGTNFEPPLELSMDVINEDKDFDRADIIFITDGQAGVSDTFVRQFNKWREPKHVSVYSILINAYDATDVSLNLFSDEVVTLSSLKDEDEAADKVASGIFQHVQ